MNLEDLKQDAALCGRPIDDEQAEKVRDILNRGYGGRDTGDIPLRSFADALLQARGEK